MSQRSYVLGMGSGIIFAVFIFFVAYSFDFRAQAVVQAAPVKLSEQEIIDQAKSIGMVFMKDTKSEPIKEKVEEQTQESFTEVNMTPLGSVEDTLAVASVPVPTQKEYVEIVISKGMTSKKIADLLEEKGVILDAKTFNGYSKEKGVTKELWHGAYRLYKGMSYDEILATISR